MPYIGSASREEIAGGRKAFSPGELNYVITLFVRDYWYNRPGYRTLAEITGVLENVKQEFYRRIAAPYENTKIVENGDVY